MPYKLSATLKAHSADVRGLASPSADLVISGSRDKTAIAWMRGASSSPFEPKVVFRGSNGFVSAVAYILPSSDAPQGYVLTGGQDAIINVYALAHASDEPNLSLIGHKQNVCALHVGEDGTIISGSWDKTAKVWKSFAQTYDLRGHEQAVWAVLALPEDRYVTGSADKTIKVWQGDKCIKSFQAHSDVIRGLAVITDIGFATCSNAGDIIIWTSEGDQVAELHGHTAFVYSLAVLPSGTLVSAGEDRTVRIWKDFENTETLVHPAISVWAVSTMPNGDIVSGSSDGAVRVFSEAEERWAPSSELKAYDEQVASQARPSQEMENMKTSDPDVLTRPGNKPGQTVMIKKTGGIEVYQWDANANQWQKIGDVVDAVGPGRRKMYEGREYDYVFDVDIQEGVPPLQLPYNVSENPYSAAQRFLERHELPAGYLDQVTDFITKNTKGEILGGGDQAYSDPFTGASKYQSSSASVPTSGVTPFVDPFTGAARYQSATTAGVGPGGSSGNLDPFTSSSGYSGDSQQTSASIVPRKNPQVLPVRTQVFFKQANIPKMLEKINELAQSSAALALNPEEEACFKDLAVYLVEAGRGTTDTISVAPAERHLSAITNVLQRWPLESRFPVLDLARLVSIHCSAAFASAESRSGFLAVLLDSCDIDAGWDQVTQQRLTNVLLTLRAIANLFQSGTPNSDGYAVLKTLQHLPYIKLGKPHRLALATLLFNFSCMTLNGPIDTVLRSAHLKIVFEVLDQERIDSTPDHEIIYRSLVALGNAVYAARESKTSLEATEEGKARAIPAAFATFRENRISTMLQDLAIFL